MSSRSSLLPNRQKKMSIIPPYNLHTPSILPRKPLNSTLNNLLEESQLKDFEELLERSNILSEEQLHMLLILILKKDPEERNLAEIQFLEKRMQHFEFFLKIKEKIPENYYYELYKELRFETHQKNSLIFSFGDIGKKIFIVLKGAVYVLVPKLKVQKQDDSLIKKFDDLTNSQKKYDNFIFEDEESNEIPSPKNLQKLNHIKPISFTLCEDDEHKLLEKFPNFRIVNILKQGALFGEVSLTLKEPRTATVICKEDSMFCILKSITFEKIVKANYDKELNFLQKISLFRALSLQNIAIIKGYLQENIYNMGYVIFKPGDDSNFIYAIKEGEVEMYKTLTSSECGDSESSLKYSLISYAKEKLLNIKKTTSLIRKLTIGQTFGEEEIFLKTRRNCLVIVSSSKARILSLKKLNFFDNLKSLHILKNIEQDFNFKDKWQKRNIKHIIKHRRLHENKTEVSDLQKSEQIRNQLKTKEGKDNMLKSLTLKLVKTKEFLPLMQRRKSEYSSSQIKSKEPFQGCLNSERKFIKKSFMNMEISPILKMSAMTNTLTMLERRKKKFSMPNLKVLIQNYENELKKQIEMKVFKKNVGLEGKFKGIVKKNEEREKISNGMKIKKICDSLRMTEDEKERFQFSFGKTQEFKKNK